MLTTYKIDMAAALEHMARLEGLPTSYEDRNDAIRIKNIAVQKSQSKRSKRKRNNGPPDKNKDFQLSMLIISNMPSLHHVYVCLTNRPKQEKEEECYYSSHCYM